MFVCHDLSFNVFSSFKDATRPRWARVVRLVRTHSHALAGTWCAVLLPAVLTAVLVRTQVIAFATLVWWTMGYSGLLVTQRQAGGVPSDILNAFADDDVAANVGRLLLSLNIMISLPYSIFMPRVSLQSLFKLALGPRLHDTSFHVLATVCLMFSGFLTALFVTDLGFVYVSAHLHSISRVHAHKLM